MADDHDDTRRTNVRTGRMVEEKTAQYRVRPVKPKQRRRRMILRQLTGPGAPRDLVLSKPEVIIGRGKQVHYSIESPEMSRQHLRLEFDGAEYACTDLGSQNGMFLNGIEVHSCILRDGDTLQAGNITFLFYESGA